MRHAKLTRESFHVFQANAENALKQSAQVPSVLICAGTGCIAGGALKIYDNLKSECEQRGLKVYFISHIFNFIKSHFDKVVYFLTVYPV